MTEGQKRVILFSTVEQEHNLTWINWPCSLEYKNRA